MEDIYEKLTVVPERREKLSWVIDDDGNNDCGNYYHTPICEVDSGSSTEISIPIILERFIRLGVVKMKEFIDDQYSNDNILEFEKFGGIIYNVAIYSDNKYSFKIIEPDAGRNWNLDSRSYTIINLKIESELMFSETNK
jgi:hypothetical protein